MIGVGFLLVFAGYVGDLWGAFLLTGKNVGLKTLFSSTWPPNVPGATGGPNPAPTDTPTPPSGPTGGNSKFLLPGGAYPTNLNGQTSTTGLKAQ